MKKKITTLLVLCLLAVVFTSVTVLATEIVVVPATVTVNANAQVNTAVPAVDTQWSSIVTLDSRTWYKISDDQKIDGELSTYTPMTESESFEGGKSYLLDAAFDSTNYNASTVEWQVKLNDKTADYVYPDTSTSSYFHARWKITVPTTSITSLAITITDIESGALLDYTADVSPQPEGSISNDISTKWYVYNGESWDNVTNNDSTPPKAEKDKTYKCEITVKPNSGFSFDGTADSVNGDEDTDKNKITFNKDGSVTITREYTAYEPKVINFTKTVELGGNTAPGEQIFKFNIVPGAEAGNDFAALSKVVAEVATNGNGSYDGQIKLYGASANIDHLLQIGFFVYEKNGNEANWSYSDKIWYVCYFQDDGADESTIHIYPATYDVNNGYQGNIENPANTIEFVNTYTYNTENPATTTTTSTTTATPTSSSRGPATYDSSTIAVWAVLILASAGALAGVALNKKRGR